jgi:hypothetical protein
MVLSGGFLSFIGLCNDITIDDSRLFYNRFTGMFIILTPFIPLSFEGEGEEYKKRGFASL